MLAFMVHLEKVLSHNGNDGLVFDELKDLFPETLGLRDSAPPVEVKSLKQLEIPDISAIGGPAL